MKNDVLKQISSDCGKVRFRKPVLIEKPVYKFEMFDPNGLKIIKMISCPNPRTKADQLSKQFLKVKFKRVEKI